RIFFRWVWGPRAGSFLGVAGGKAVKFRLADSFRYPVWGGIGVMKRLNLENLHILVVDDNAFMRNLMSVILKGLRVGRVQIADNVDGGLDIVKRFAVDIAFVDWNMPTRDGLDFVRTVRQGGGGIAPFLPVIMLTGHTEQNRVIEARDAGVDEFLAKPISVSSVYRRIYSVIERRRSFIRTGSYFGPDRRRHDIPMFAALKRRKTDIEAPAPMMPVPETMPSIGLESKAPPVEKPVKEAVSERPRPDDPNAMSQREVAAKLRKKP
ncbi:MAG: response regulator, partial [Magnetospirillum sp. WYHS-4]